MAIVNVRMPDGSLQQVSHPDDWTDDQVADSIKKNFAPEGSSITKDILNSISDVPSGLINAFLGLPGKAYDSAVQVATNPIRASENIGSGLLEGVKGGLNIPSNIAKYLDQKNIGRGAIESLIEKAHIPDTGLQKYVLGNQQPGDELLQGISSFAPYAKLGGLASGLEGVAKRAGASAVYATGQDQNPLTAALAGSGGEYASKLGQSAIPYGLKDALQNTLKRTNKGVDAAEEGFQKPYDLKDVWNNTVNSLFRTNLRPEELKTALEQTQGTKTPLGEVLQKPYLKKFFDNFVQELPFSGSEKILSDTSSIIQDRGQNILNNLKGDSDISDIGQKLKDSLIENYYDIKSKKQSLFDDVNKAAKDAGITTDRSNLRNTARNILSEINKDPALKDTYDPELISFLERRANDKENNYDLESTDKVRGNIGYLANKSKLSDKNQLNSYHYTQLKNAALKDINDAIDKSNNSNIHSLRDKAMDFYKNEYAPFMDRKIMDFTTRDADPDTLLSTFLKTSPFNDRANLLGKITSKLSPEDKNLLGYSYLSRAIDDNDKINPNKFATAYNKLGDKQKSLLFDKNTNDLDNYIGLIKRNPEAINSMYNPKTGARGILPYWISALSAAGGGLATGNLPGALSGGLLSIMSGKPLASLLTNEKVRNSIANSIISSKKNNYTPSTPSNISPFVNALIQAQAQGNQT